MDGPPRAFKRRRIDQPITVGSTPLIETPIDVAPAPLAKPARKSNKGGEKKEKKEKEKAPKKATASAPKKTRNATRTQDTEKKDVWDDIEGALGEGPPKRIPPKRTISTKTTRASCKEDTASDDNDTDELQTTKSAPKRGRKGAVATKESASRGASKQPVNGYEHTAEEEPEVQDEVGKKASGPGRQGGRFIKQAVTRKPRTRRADGLFAPSDPSARKKPTPDVQRQEASEAEDELASAVPSRRRKQTRFQIKETIPESEDETAKTAKTAKATKLAGARRKAHRADHTNNEEEMLVDLDDADVMSVDGISIVGSMLDPTEPSPFNKPSPIQKSKPAVPLLNGNLEAGRELDLLKTIVFERITGKRPAPLVNLDEEYASVYQLVEHTITAGEGNSMLLIGSRGCGKTSLVNKVLSEVSKENSEDYHVVRLNGFIHTDDKIALREIWRQLGKEMDLEEDSGGVGKNYADTLTTLLALLSHPSEQTGEITDHVAKAVIFVMDEFDLFAQHPRQTLLYNLFDIAQSRKAPIAVLGLTTRIDVANSLEKRVKSRFSHRYVHLSLAKTFTAFQEMCKANLLIQPDQLNVEERSILEPTAKPQAKKNKKSTKPDILKDWNTTINTLFTTKSFLTTHLAPPFYQTKSLPQILTTFLHPIATLTPSIPLTPTTTLIPPQTLLPHLPHLSTLSLSLLISAARLDIIHDTDSCNFNMAYDEYMTLASKARIQNGIGGVSVGGSMSKVWGKEVARREWEGLVELGFVVPVLAGLGAGAFGMVRCDVSLEEIGAVLAGKEGRGVEKGLERWCRQI
ncbi:hypothetical protein P280DRAFT_532906 [Massarina eburnea CBS 473.64]|uniref:Origin recognition complex subunit 4 n=1 Tax=Massarina eburnea CBS 473.64 TaxID=1395130 RepID=A0A6A6RNS2_9PLEO|nr:hypothetical protein P280DRAFT_532906 [Massarina eburnea CBS 473.64]